MKTCNRCKETKSFSEFYPRSDKISGYRHTCKPCRNRKDPKVKQLGRQAHLTPEERKINDKKAQKKWRSNNLANLAFREATRRAYKLQQTPKWLTKEQLQEMERIYDCARSLSEFFGEPVHVDHIVPLKGKDVRGLHVPWNLQITDALYNQRKNNKLES